MIFYCLNVHFQGQRVNLANNEHQRTRFDPFKWHLECIFRRVCRVYLSVHMGKFGSHIAGFNEVWHFSIFRKSIERTQVAKKQGGKNNRYFVWRPMYIYDNFSWNSSQNGKCFGQKYVEEIKTHILCSVTFFFRKSWQLWDNVEKYCRAGQATDGSRAHALCMLDNCIHTLRICNTYCSSKARVVMRTRALTYIARCNACLSVSVMFVLLTRTI